MSNTKHFYFICSLASCKINSEEQVLVCIVIWAQKTPPWNQTIVCKAKQDYAISSNIALSFVSLIFKNFSGLVRVLTQDVELLKCPATHLQARIFSWPMTYFVLSFFSPSPKPQAGSRSQQRTGLRSHCHHFFSWRIQSSSCSSHNGHKHSTQMRHVHFGHKTMCEQSHGRRHSSWLPEVSVIHCSQKVCYSNHASKERLKCKPAAENASFHHPFDSKFKFYGAQLSKSCLWGSFKINFININTHKSFVVLT